MGGRTVRVIAAAAVGWTLTAATAAAEPDPPQPPSHGAAASGTPGEASAVPPLPGPLAMDHDGTFTVGGEILPGVYTSGGPRPGETCYWRRIGAGDTTVDNALTKQPQTVQIAAGDAAFKTNGCQPWQLAVGAAPPGQNPPWLSQLQLRHNLDVLNGLARQSGNGQLPPY